MLVTNIGMLPEAFDQHYALATRLQLIPFKELEWADDKAFSPGAKGTLEHAPKRPWVYLIE